MMLWLSRKRTSFPRKNIHKWTWRAPDGKSQCTYNVTCNHCCSGITIPITYSECAFVDLGIQHAMRIRHSYLWPAQIYHIFTHYVINGTIFEKKVTEHKMCDLIFSTTFVLNIKLRWSKMYTGPC
jgi:hypothetical protein